MHTDLLTNLFFFLKFALYLCIFLLILQQDQVGPHDVVDNKSLALCPRVQIKFPALPVCDLKPSFETL